MKKSVQIKFEKCMQNMNRQFTLTELRRALDDQGVYWNAERLNHYISEYTKQGRLLSFMYFCIKFADYKGERQERYGEIKKYDPALKEDIARKINKKCIHIALAELPSEFTPAQFASLYVSAVTSFGYREAACTYQQAEELLDKLCSKSRKTNGKKTYINPAPDYSLRNALVTHKERTEEYRKQKEKMLDIR